MPKQQKAKPRPSRWKAERRKKKEWKEKQKATVRQEYQQTTKPYNKFISNTIL
jgi:F0F1-type ATP synthase assembly protein I